VVTTAALCPGVPRGPDSEGQRADSLSLDI
jgi:hypothetical protein